MHSPPLLLVTTAAALVAATSVGSAHAAGPPVCNAKHKRSANPYGSVLATGLKPAVATAAEAAPPATGTAGSPVKGERTVPKPVAISRTELRASMVPCGGAA